MARIVGIHQVELKPGVTAEAFEEAARTMAATPTYPGFRGSLVKSDRGTGVGRYGLLIEIESVEARNRFMGDNGPTKEGTQFDADHPAFIAAWGQLMSLVVQPYPWNDYVVA